MSLHKHWRDCKAWKDIGLPFTTTSNEACKLFDAALTQYVGWYDEPTVGGLEKTLKDLLQADPKNVMAYVVNNGLELISSGQSPRLNPEFQKSLNIMSQLANESKELSDWERQHVKAVSLCGQGYMADACDVWEDILLDHPQDMLALKFAHDSYFYLGYQPQMRDSIARVMPRWKEDAPLYSYLFGMYSFGLCETNLFDQAEKMARRGLEMNAKDAWSTHSLAHVFEMCGRQKEGLSFLSTTVSDWSYCGMLACHNYWHWALYHIEKEEHQGAVDIFDSEVCKRFLSSGAMFDLIDACSLLFRLEMEGIEVGDRWNDIYEMCRCHLDDHMLAFSDAHLMMAYLGAKKGETVSKLLSSMKKYVEECLGTNQTVTKDVGRRLCEALVAYDDGRYAEAVDLLHPLKYKLVQIGGSNAQRDIFSQFLIHASMKSANPKHHKLARSLLAERKCLKDAAPLTDRLIAKYTAQHAD